MLFLGRQLLRILAFAFGSSFILRRNQLGTLAQTAIQPKVSPSLLRGPLFVMGSLEGRKWKSDGYWRIVLPSSRSDSAGALVPATSGGLAHTIKLRGIRLAARSRTHRFRSFR